MDTKNTTQKKSKTQAKNTQAKKASEKRAGRISIYEAPMLRKTLRIPAYQLKHVLSKGNLSKVIRDLIEKDIQNGK